ncbi:MAG: aminoacyl-histidine dipeptidase [Clostridiales bacterium]|nr:MAG: aminoacyl-histidine dipeptidase [Clostridiales bacterium]
MENKVINFFEEITKIPHCSGSEKQLSDYLVVFARERGLSVHQDKSLNVIIKKAGSKGRENETPVILQGHMDMVCIAKKGVDIDFSKDPIPYYIDGDYIKSKGTSLGADNGIAVAMIMAILDGDYSHPPIEALITTDEEVGLLGAANVDGSLFKGKTLINLDSEEEGVFLASCAGGIRNTIKLPIETKDIKKKKAYKVTISGLMGGHSGMEIHKYRASALKLLGRLLSEIASVRIFDVTAGNAANSIADNATVYIATNTFIDEDIEKMQKIFSEEYKVNDPDIKISFEEVPVPDVTWSKITTKKFINALLVLPHGVLSMNTQMEGLVDTSTNLSSAKVVDDHIVITGTHRSIVETKKMALVKRYVAVAELIGAQVATFGGYPGWEYVNESNIRDVFTKVYEKMTGEKAVISAIHAGLECGILKRNIGDIDMISLGPNIYDVHSPKEKLSISSTNRVFELLINVLDNMHSKL